MERICKFNLSGQFLRYLESRQDTHSWTQEYYIPSLGNSSYSFENKSRSIALWILDGSSIYVGTSVYGILELTLFSLQKKIYLNSRSLSKIRVFFFLFTGWFWWRTKKFRERFIANREIFEWFRISQTRPKAFWFDRRWNRYEKCHLKKIEGNSI